MDETNPAFISQFNEYLDVALFWFILYEWLHWTILLAGIGIGLTMPILITMGFLYNDSLKDIPYNCGKKECKVCN